MATFLNVERTNILKLVVAMFNAPPGASYLNEIVSLYQANGNNLSALAQSLSNTGAYNVLNPKSQIATEFAANFLTPYGLQNNAVAVDFIVSKFNAGVNKGQISLDAATAINNYTGTDAGILAAQAIQNNKASVAEYYSVNKAVPQTDLAALQAVFGGVTDATSSVIAAKAAVDVAAVGQTTFTLTTGLDSLVGSAGNDVFSANVVQNSLGAQTNQLATGDKIVGGLGLDTLNAVVQMASPLNNGPESAIAPITTGVEQTFYTAISTSNKGLLDNNEIVNINAKFETGLTKVGSVQSDASLFIQNLNTLTDTGVYADRRNTSDITVRMDHSGNDRAADAQSNMTVLFDNDYLTSGSVNTNRLEIRAANNVPLKDSNLPLTNFTSVAFKVNGVDVITFIPAAVQGESGLTAYATLKTLIEAQLVKQGITGVVVNLLPQETTIFSIALAGKAQGSLAGVFTPIEIVSTAGQLSKGLISLATNLTDFNGVNTETLGAASNQVNPITSNIELLKVGRGSDGGSLVVGGMATDLANNLKFSTAALKEGVDQFNIVVSGDTTQMSSLSNLASTNNTLKTVNVTYAAGSLADLYIGNHNTALNTVANLRAVNGANNTVDNVANVSSVANLALKDVKTFTAVNNNSDSSNPLSVQTNDVTLNAYLSDQVVAKYMNRVDTAADAAADNANFVYTTGAGNDVINLNISKSNLAASGTATREDFSLKINAGDGNNTVVTQIGDGVGSATDAWFVNETIQKSLSITTGSGNDVVRVNGAGSWNINTGAGNDVIYSDNSGRQVIQLNPNGGSTGGTPTESNAVWVFNSADQSQGTAGLQILTNLQSATAVLAADKVANLQLTVSYRGLTSTVAVGDTALAAGGSVNDLTINQAIKAAINGDVYLHNLLVAQDGTGRTLIVTALTDGVFSDADISISVANTGALSAAQTTAGAAFLTPTQLTALGLTSTGAFVAGGRFDSAIAEDNSVFTIENAPVTFGAISAAGGTESIGGLTITGATSVIGFNALQVAQVAAGATIAGLTVTSAPTLFTVSQTDAQVGTATAKFTATSFGNVTDIGGVSATGGGTAPTIGTITQGNGDPSIHGAKSAQANANIIEAGPGLDTVVLSTAGGLLSKEVVNVASAIPEADVVFNASAGAVVTVDILDTVVSSSGFYIKGAPGTFTFTANGINGTAGNDFIDGTQFSAGVTINGLAGNDTIIASLLGSTVIGGDGSDIITFQNNASVDTLVFNSLIGADTISGFKVANDFINLSKAAFVGITGAVGANIGAEFASNATGTAVLATDHFIYNTTTGALNYDADGSGTGAAVLVGTFTDLPGLTAAQFTIIA